MRVCAWVGSQLAGPVFFYRVSGRTILFFTPPARHLGVMSLCHLVAPALLFLTAMAFIDGSKTSLEEFQMEVCGWPLSDHDCAKHTRSRFNELDMSGDGFVTREEVMAVLLPNASPKVCDSENIACECADTAGQSVPHRNGWQANTESGWSESTEYPTDGSCNVETIHAKDFKPMELRHRDTPLLIVNASAEWTAQLLWSRTHVAQLLAGINFTTHDLDHAFRPR
jgi:hypothetical protein